MLANHKINACYLLFQAHRSTSSMSEHAISIFTFLENNLLSLPSYVFVLFLHLLQIFRIHNLSDSFNSLLVFDLSLLLSLSSSPIHSLFPALSLSLCLNYPHLSSVFYSLSHLSFSLLSSPLPFSTTLAEGLLVRAEKAIDAQTSHILALTAELQAQQALISKVWSIHNFISSISIYCLSMFLSSYPTLFAPFFLPLFLLFYPTFTYNRPQSILFLILYVLFTITPLGRFSSWISWRSCQHGSSFCCRGTDSIIINILNVGMKGPM